MSKSTHFFGQPVFGQLIKSLKRDQILELSHKCGGERYVKSFDGWHHLVSMLYAIIMRFDSLREIETSMLAEARKLTHIGLKTVPKRSTVSDANKRRPHTFFESVYRYLYQKNKDLLLTDSRSKSTPEWMKRLIIIDSTTISLFSNLIFKGCGRNPKFGKKKGGVKMHSILSALEGVFSDVRFTSAATHDSFMLVPNDYQDGDHLVFDRAYINFKKFEELTNRNVVYVTKMKSNLTYKVEESCRYMDPSGKMAYREEQVVFQKGEISHRARIVTYVDIKKDTQPKLVRLLTNDFELQLEDIVQIYKKRWQIESLFKQIKQNFPLRYFYGESANAIKIQVWVTLIANLLLTVLQRKLQRKWSFSGLATMVRIVLMYYLNLKTLFESPEKDYKKQLMECAEPPPMATLFA